MKYLSALLLISSLSISNSVAAEDYIDFSAGYQTTTDIFDYGRKVQTIKNMLANADYELLSCQEYPIYYYIEPQKNIFLTSTYTCKYSVPAPYLFYVSDYAEFSVEVFWNKMIMLNHEGQVKVRYWTVY